MSPHLHRTDICGDDDVAAALALLARPRTIMVEAPASPSSTGALSVLRQRETGTETIGSIGAATAILLRQSEWICRQQDGSWHITRSGIQALRRSRVEIAPPAVSPAVVLRGGRPIDKPSINAAESPLSWLCQRKGKDGAPLINEAQFDAGERLRADFTKAQMMPRITAAWSDTTPSRRQRRTTPGAGVDLADSVIAAKDRVRRALVAVGPELAGMLIDVCCHLKGLEEAERLAELPQRSGKVLLLTALSALARHYGFISPDSVEAQISRRIRVWSADDTKPHLDHWRDA